MPIYFIRPGQLKIVKIGHSDMGAAARMRYLQCANHEPLTLLGTMEGSRDLEYELHKTFDNYRLHSEWFRLEGDLEELINNLPPPATPEPKRKRGATPKIDDAMKRRIQKKAALKGDKKMTLQVIADSEDIALSSIFGIFKGGRKGILAWKPD